MKTYTQEEVDIIVSTILRVIDKDKTVKNNTDLFTDDNVVKLLHGIILFQHNTSNSARGKSINDIAKVVHNSVLISKVINFMRNKKDFNPVSIAELLRGLYKEYKCEV